MEIEALESTKLVHASTKFTNNNMQENNTFKEACSESYEWKERCSNIDPNKADGENASLEMTSSCEQCQTSEEASLIRNNYETNCESGVGKITNSQALLHIIKVHMVTGLLGSPRAVENAGLWVGGILFLACGLAVLYGMHLMLKCSQQMGKRLSAEHYSWTYQDIVETSIRNGAHRTQRFAGVGRKLSMVLNAVLQAGVCSIYIIVVSDSVKQVIHQFYSNDPDVRVYMLVMLVVLIPFSQVNRLDIMVVFSAIGIVLYVASLLITLGYMVTILPPVTTRPAFNSWTTLALFIGQALMSMEGIATVIPIQNQMKHPQSFGGYTGVLNRGFAVIICVNVSLGFIGYLCFGENTANNILLNLPTDQGLYIAAKLMIDVSVILTFALVFYVIFTITWHPFESKITTPWLRHYGERIQRFGILILTFGCAAFVPHMDLLLALFGSFCGTLVGFFIPAVVHIIVFTADGANLSVCDTICDVAMILIGVISFVSGTYFSIKDISATFQYG